MVKKTIPKTSTASKVSTITVPRSVTKNSKDNVPSTNQSTAIADLSAGRSLSNVVGFRDLNGGSSSASSSTAQILSSTNGHTLGASGSTNQSKNSAGSFDQRASVRDIWSKKKFPSTSSTNEPPKTNTATDSERPVCLHSPPQSNWVAIDDDIAIENVVHETFTILDDSVSNLDNSSSNLVQQTSEQGTPKYEIIDSFHDDDITDSDIELIDRDSSLSLHNSSSGLVRQTSDQVTIKREIIDSFHDDDITDSDIELIDHDYDDSEGAPTGGLCDKKITDNLFSWNKSTEDLNKIHMTDEENAGNSNRELVSCPVCNIKCERDLMSDHLDGCLGLVRKIDPRRAVKPAIRNKKSPKTKNARTSTITTSTTEGEEEYNRRILSEMETEARESRSNGGATGSDEWTKCPVCTNSVRAAEINDHLDICLS